MVLFDRGHYGPSRSLAISAREEFGKALASIGCLVGITPVAEYAKGLRHHTSKQADGVIAPTLGAARAARPDLLDTLLPSEAEGGVEQAAANAFDRIRSAPEWASSSDLGVTGAAGAGV